MSRRTRGWLFAVVGLGCGLLLALFVTGVLLAPLGQAVVELDGDPGLPAVFFCWDLAVVGAFLLCGVVGAVVGRRLGRRIRADLSKQAPNNSYAPPLYYEDKKFTCMDCGRVEVFTAEQQQWWYEVAKGPIYSKAVRCLACRRARRESRPSA